MSLQNAGQGVNDACFPLQGCMVMGSCRLPQFGDAPKGECGTESIWRASNMGISFAQLSTDQPYLVPGNADCSTLENRSVGAPRLDETIARSNPAHAFWQLLPASVAQEDAARHELIKEAKLMFEMGISSPNVSNDVLRALYTTAPGDELGCGVSARAPVSDACLAWGTSHGLDGALGLCQRLLSTHVATTVFDAEVNSCLDLLNRPVLAGAEACAVEYRGVVETLEERLIAKGLAGIQMAADSSTFNGLGTALARIDRWYTAAALAFAADAAALSDGTGRVLTGFWTRIYAVGSPVPDFPTGGAGSETARVQLANLFTTRIESDRQVLAAAFADPAPLDEVPLLLIVGDGFSAIKERLVTAAPLYDLACRIKGSCTVTDANEATLLIRLLGAIGDDAALGQALTAASGAGGGVVVRAPWRDMFTALRARRGALEVALRKATGRSDTTLDELYHPSVVGPAAELAEQVAGSLTMWTSYAGHGVLLPDDGVLHNSLTNANVAASLTSFQDRLNTLRADRLEYQQERGDLAQTVLTRISNQQFQARTNDEAAVLRTDYDNLGRDLDGLMASQDQAEQLVGKFLETYVERASGPQWLPDYPVSGHPAVLAIDATAARGSGSLTTDVVAVAVRDPQNPADAWHVDVGKGDLLTLDVGGAWSPTCSLRKTTLAAPSGTSVFADPTHLLIGPEGFSISWQNDKFVAKDHQSSDFSSQTSQSSICGSISTNLLTVIDTRTPTLGQLSISGSTCRQWQTGHSESDTSSSGSRFQYSANFAGGLRVPRTPFPTFPAGSLILVEVVDRPEGGTTVRDAHVVRPHSTYLFPQAGKVYLVANDEGGCTSIDPSPLAITYVHGQSVAAAARTLAETMATVLSSLQTTKASFVAQGSVTASELAALQSAAYDQLRAACQCNLSAFPEEVRGMFDAWLSAELASIERQTRIVAAERALDSLVLRLKALQDDLAGAESSSRLLALLTYWQLGHLAYHLEDPDPPLRDHAERLLEIANDMLALMRILYPQALAALRASPGPINSLRTSDWTKPYDEQVARLEDVADAVKAQIDQARNNGGQSTAPVVVVFPKPGSTPNVPGAVIAAPERLGGVWEPCLDPGGFCLRKKPIFTVTPEDVYGRPLVGLGCQEAAPVVQAFAVVAVNNGPSSNEDWNNNPRRADIFRTSEMQFPTENGILSYRTDGIGGVLAPSRVRVLATEASAVATTFDALVRSTGDLHGVSPFNSFTVDLGDAVTNADFPLKSATAVVAFFDVQTRTATGPLTGVGVCAQPLAPLAGSTGPEPSSPGGSGPDGGPLDCPVSAPLSGGGTSSTVCLPLEAAP